MNKIPVSKSGSAIGAMDTTDAEACGGAGDGVGADAASPTLASRSLGGGGELVAIVRQSSEERELERAMALSLEESMAPATKRSRKSATSSSGHVTQGFKLWRDEQVRGLITPRSSSGGGRRGE